MLGGLLGPGHRPGHLRPAARRRARAAGAHADRVRRRRAGGQPRYRRAVGRACRRGAPRRWIRSRRCGRSERSAARPGEPADQAAGSAQWSTVYRLTRTSGAQNSGSRPALRLSWRRNVRRRRQARATPPAGRCRGDRRARAPGRRRPAAAGPAGRPRRSHSSGSSTREHRHLDPHPLQLPGLERRKAGVAKRRRQGVRRARPRPAAGRPRPSRCSRAARRRASG